LFWTAFFSTVFFMAREIVTNLSVLLLF